MTPPRIALSLGLLALALILGALSFQYIGHMPPCEMCHWQRWPLFAAIAVGVFSGTLVRRDDNAATALAVLAILLVAASGAIGVYQAGAEWHWWQGPQACTGTRVVFHSLTDLNTPGQARCDLPSFRLFGLSLAGWNALIDFGAAIAASVMLLRRRA
ncbi:MAG: disulfide bond formation protein B [Alphaproteobacteria bacterium]|nr:disulfide bond formation protein B [Alphaproteobacteria bacterium]MBV9694407.1 disulfide bond formation protein B [Alphaproteobacteria bacterium]